MITGVDFPCLPLVINPNVISTAYGLCYSILNGFCTFLPMVVGVLYNDSDKNLVSPYFYGSIYIICIACMVLIIAIWIYIKDSKSG